MVIAAACAVHRKGKEIIGRLIHIVRAYLHRLVGGLHGIGRNGQYIAAPAPIAHLNAQILVRRVGDRGVDAQRAAFYDLAVGVQAVDMQGNGRSLTIAAPAALIGHGIAAYSAGHIMQALKIAAGSRADAQAVILVALAYVIIRPRLQLDRGRTERAHRYGQRIAVAPPVAQDQFQRGSLRGRVLPRLRGAERGADVKVCALGHGCGVHGLAMLVGKAEADQRAVGIVQHFIFKTVLDGKIARVVATAQACDIEYGNAAGLAPVQMQIILARGVLPARHIHKALYSAGGNTYHKAVIQAYVHFFRRRRTQRGVYSYAFPLAYAGGGKG